MRLSTYINESNNIKRFPKLNCIRFDCSCYIIEAEISLKDLIILVNKQDPDTFRITIENNKNSSFKNTLFIPVDELITQFTVLNNNVLFGFGRNDVGDNLTIEYNSIKTFFMRLNKKLNNDSVINQLDKVSKIREIIMNM